MIELLKEMIRIRRFEERAARLYGEGKIRGFLHLYIGEEAIAAGVMRSLRPEDAVVATYREHGHALARGIPARTILAEMYGKRQGCCHGRGGSMHLFDAAKRFFGGNAIVAGGLPLAAGLALADKMQKDIMQRRAAITACFFGDGAVAEGEFHEVMNLAALWELPVLFCCENNRYAMGTALERSHSQINIAETARAYKIDSRQVDGMDVNAVHQAATDAAASVRSTRKPCFIEFLTYRFCAHSMFDAELYRSKKEVEEWKLRDPIPLQVKALQQSGALPDSELRALEEAVEAELDEAVAFAEAGTWEPIENLLKDVYTERLSTSFAGVPS